jgi:hypothetical protein
LPHELNNISTCGFYNISRPGEYLAAWLNFSLFVKEKKCLETLFPKMVRKRKPQKAVPKNRIRRKKRSEPDVGDELKRDPVIGVSHLV